jgi:predicted nucleotidyltransferase
MPVYIDFLTEHPKATTGTTHVDGVEAGVFPGVARALSTRRIVPVSGKDLFGAPQKADVPVAEVGPLLVLKLNAFGGRQQPKDAYDTLLLVSRYLDGPEAAVAAFRAEKEAGNRGYARAAAALRQHFVDNDQSGPLRAAAFVLGDQPREPEARERERRIIEQMVTIGHALSEE